MLFVVDNDSPKTEKLIEVFNKIESVHEAKVILNPKNDWIYGFNLALSDNSWPASHLYAFSDADIYVPIPVNGICWLEHLVDQMNQFCSIGKLGLSLDHSNLESNPSLAKSLEIERRYLSGPKIGENTVALVDTTMTLYRSDLFITKQFKFQIGHASLIKPQYYTCRASREYLAYHVGWDYYPNATPFAYSKDKQWLKALALYKAGAFVAPELLGQFSATEKIILRTVQKVVRGMHGIKVAFLMLMYLCKKFPRNINEIQSSVRW